MARNIATVFGLTMASIACLLASDGEGFEEFYFSYAERKVYRMVYYSLGIE